jgi:hypothetical protein
LTGNVSPTRFLAKGQYFEKRLCTGVLQRTYAQ